MNRKLQKIFVLAFVMLGFFACNDDDVNYEKDVPIVVRFQNETNSINVDDEILFDIPVQLSKPVDTEVTVKYEVTSNTLIENEDFTDISGGEVVIPIGDVVGKILFSSKDGVYDDGSKSFIITITDLIGEASISATALSNPSLQVIFNACPSVAIPDDMFVGDYYMERVSDPGPLGLSAFDNGVVEVMSQGDGMRSFSSVFYAGAGIGQPAIDFMFTLDLCGEITVEATQQTNLSCGGAAILLGPSENTGTYEFAPLDDQTFTIVFVEFESAACGVSDPYENTYTFTKQ